MEKRTPLYLYLEKIKKGDTTFAAKLCQQLADRLIYVPILAGAEGRKTENKIMTVKAVRLDADGRSRVPIFTTEKCYRTWAESFSDKTEYISLLGGDFCGALSKGTCLIIDPGADYSVELDHETTSKIAASTTTEMGARGASQSSADLPNPMFQDQLRGRSEPTSLMKRPQRQKMDFDQDKPALPTPNPSLPTSEVTGSTQQPIQEQLKKIKREQFPAYQPVEKGEGDSSGIEDTLVDGEASVQRTVIFSPDTDANRVVREKEDPNKKKKRSFLNFLKGN